MNNLLPLIPDEIFNLNKEFIADPRIDKINGGIGVIVDEKGKPYVLPVVQKVITQIRFDNFNYLPVAGDKEFLANSASIVFGNNLDHQLDANIAKQGVAGGTNGLFILSSFIAQQDNHPRILLSNPTWENHRKIFSYLKFTILEYDHIDNRINFNLSSLTDELKKNPSIYVLFHGGLTHNPTGVNPNNKQWKDLIPYLLKGRHHIIFDFAYMGLGDTIEKDSYPIRLFLKHGIPVSIILSYSKNMTLYQQRTGAILLSCLTPSEKIITEQHLQKIFRIVNSNPPAFGELIVKTILSNDELKSQWLMELNNMKKLLQKRRRLFVQYGGTKFRHIQNEKGLFSLLYLNQTTIKTLKDSYGIYLLANSRINFGGIPSNKISFLTQALAKITAR